MGCEVLLVMLWTLFLCCSCQRNQNREQILQSIYKVRRLPGLNVCGKSASSTFEVKIINGKPADLGAYPWMANIGYQLPESVRPEWLCAGSLITDQYVISAAHCLEPATLMARRPWRPTTVRLGDLDLNPEVKDGATPMDFGIETIVYHPRYNNTLKVNDIGLIKLRGKVQFTALIRPICLPPPEFQYNLFIGYSPIVAGWGKSMNNRGNQGTRLLEAEVEIKETESCRKNITSTRLLSNAIIDQRVLCAASPGKDSCQGDSGGPLMFFRRVRKNSEGNMFLMGIVSYGFSCALEGYPGVYTRVSEYMAWIINNLDI